MTALTDLIRHDIPLSVGAYAEYAYSKKIEKDYRFKTRFGDEVLLYRVNDKTIQLPRALCPIGENDNRVEGKVVLFPKCPKPRDNQIEMFEETKAFLLEGHSGITVAPTGRGKTVLGYAMAYAVQRKTLVICTKDDIYKKWIKDAPTFLGIAPHEVGEIRQNKCEVVGTKFVVAMIHSLAGDKYPEWIDEEFGLVIFDECHRVAADHLSEVAWKFRAKLRLGLSATIKRMDGKELLVYAHIGPVRVKIDDEDLIPKVLRFTTSWKCPRKMKVNKTTGEKKIIRLPHEPGKTAHIERMIAEDTQRNIEIMDSVISAVEKGRRVVVFSTLHDHLNNMAQVCIERGLGEKEFGFYISATTKAEREYRETVTVKPIIFTTFVMMSEGTDIPWLDTCVFAMPRSEITQAAGRVRRVYEDKRFPLIMDFVDTDSPVFLAYAVNRMRWYKGLGCEIVDMN